MPFGPDLSLPRRMKKSDLFIPYGQGRDIVVPAEPEASERERAAVETIQRRACDVSRRMDLCIYPNITTVRPLSVGAAARPASDGSGSGSGSSGRKNAARRDTHRKPG